MPGELVDQKIGKETHIGNAVLNHVSRRKRY